MGNGRSLQAIHSQGVGRTIAAAKGSGLGACQWPPLFFFLSLEPGTGTWDQQVLLAADGADGADVADEWPGLWRRYCSC